MELPAEVLIHNPVLGMKGSRGFLLQISESGYYLCNCTFGEKTHQVLLPIDNTILIVQAPVESFEEVLEVER